MAWGEFCISNLIFSPNGFLVASRIITYSCLAFWEVLRTRLSRLTDEKTRWRRPCKNEAMLHPHLRLKSSTCCAKKLKGRIYGKSLFAQLFCGLIFRYFSYRWPLCFFATKTPEKTWDERKIETDRKCVAQKKWPVPVENQSWVHDRLLRKSVESSMRLSPGARRRTTTSTVRGRRVF